MTWTWLWRFHRSAKAQRREFVYLDETCVTSLVAARDGEITESVKNTLRACLIRNGTPGSA